MRDEAIVVQVVVDLLAQPLVFGFVKNEVAEFSFVYRDDLSESPCRGVVPLKLVKECGENGIILCAFKILTAIVKSLEQSHLYVKVEPLSVG